VKEGSVTSKFNELLAQHAKATEASSKSGSDDEEFGELEKLLQDALGLQNGVHKIRSDFKKHEIDEDEKATADDATTLAAAGSRRVSPRMRGRCAATKRRRSGSSLVASATSALPTDETLATSCLKQRLEHLPSHEHEEGDTDSDTWQGRRHGLMKGLDLLAE
jgi:hypothetical protein